MTVGELATWMLLPVIAWAMLVQLFMIVALTMAHVEVQEGEGKKRTLNGTGWMVLTTGFVIGMYACYRLMQDVLAVLL